MSEAKFTKGDWKVQVEQPYPHTLSEILTVVTDDFDVVCVPHGIRNQYDAHLMVAAPEMYEEIESDISILESQLVDAKTHGEANRLQNRIIRKVKLLAKARGEKC